jgi:Fe2+ transport system protein FeoA
LAEKKEGERVRVVGVCADGDTRNQLEHLGFVGGADVSVLRQVRGDVIVRVGQSRLALTGGHARWIMVQDA